MRRARAYTGIDAFRMVAALLVVAIHTAPLGDVNPTADFILTRVIARVAVPFFFMTSGFFLFGRGLLRSSVARPCGYEQQGAYR